VWLHYGNGGDGADRAPQQRRTPNTLTVGLLGTSDSETSVRLRARCRTAAGRGNVGFEWEVKPIGTPFDGTGLGRINLLDSGGPGLAGSMIQRSGLASGLAPGTLHHWRLRIITDSPRFPRSPWMTHPGNAAAEADFRTAGTALAAGDDAPTIAFALDAARPNPSAGPVAIRFTLPAPGRVDLAVFDLQGRRMATLARGVVEAGAHVAHWDGHDAGGSPAAAGTYFARLAVGGEVRTTKLVRTR
jgi:hypothetical protein